MSKYRYEIGGIIRDTEIDFPYYTDEIIELLDEKDQHISDLEAKLKESEEQIWALENQKLHAHNCLNKLKQQLAEKEKMLERIMSGEYIPANIAEKSLKLSNQDKISFTLEQLEKVKKNIVDKMNNPYILDIRHILLEFDNQIKQLKEGK